MEQKNSIKSVTSSKGKFEGRQIGAPLRQLHEAFSWLPRGSESDPDAKFTALVKDIAGGSLLALELVQTSNLQRDCDAAPTLNSVQTEQMMFLAMRSIEMLGDLADERILNWKKAEMAKAAAAASEGVQA